MALALARRREQWPQQARAACQPKWESQTAHMLWAMEPGLWYTRDDVVALLWPQDAERCRLNRVHVNSRLFKPGYVERTQDPAREPGRLRAERRHLYRLTPKGIAYRDLLSLLS